MRRVHCGLARRKFDSETSKSAERARVSLAPTDFAPVWLIKKTEAGGAKPSARSANLARRLTSPYLGPPRSDDIPELFTISRCLWIAVEIGDETAAG
jgi:hypothetical protein